MTPEQWARVKDVFTRALERPVMIGSNVFDDREWIGA